MAENKASLTPMMQQYWTIKSSHPDKLLLFRLGDFFELFFEDALQASSLLNLTLTRRNKKSKDSVPMCGFPHHILTQQVNKLLGAGHKVVIYDQVESPREKAEANNRFKSSEERERGELGSEDCTMAMSTPARGSMLFKNKAISSKKRGG